MVLKQDNTVTKESISYPNSELVTFGYVIIENQYERHLYYPYD